MRHIGAETQPRPEQNGCDGRRVKRRQRDRALSATGDKPYLDAVRSQIGGAGAHVVHDAVDAAHAALPERRDHQDINVFRWVRHSAPAKASMISSEPMS